MEQEKQQEREWGKQGEWRNGRKIDALDLLLYEIYKYYDEETDTFNFDPERPPKPKEE